ncbi:hypothetical protein [Sciscionella sediminilitoris]|uniref:hypothetical protein n=1 Tax=Sciscionella sediminilitoris TaxID=1445613 RepID=UPI0012E17DF9|nr:hypothetical protein [Sciscionella sp. SE31]
MTDMNQDRDVAIVGGSIAGCAAAIAVRRNGYRPTVFERGAAELTERGMGVVLPVPLWESLTARGYLRPDTPKRLVHRRIWLVPERGDARGRIAWSHSSEAALTGWWFLWHALRDRLTESEYRGDSAVYGMERDGKHTVLRFGDGGIRPATRIIAADGHRSVFRTVRHEYADYVAWRGSYGTGRIADLDLGLLDGAYVTTCFPFGHGVFALVPGVEGTRLDWVVYGPRAPGMSTAQSGFGGLPGSAAGFLHQLAGRHLPPLWATLVERTGEAELSVHPVADLPPAEDTGDVLLAGDAAALVRPHAASGAGKALRDALAIEDLAAAYPDWPELAARYRWVRNPEAARLVALGRRLGRRQVEHPPAWDRMTAPDYAAWMSSVLDGTAHYLYPWIPAAGQ